MMRTFLLLFMLLSLSCGLAARVDSVRAAHCLNEVEVLGVKEMPTPGNTPVTVLRAAQLRRLGIQAVKNLSDIVPNLYAPSYGSRMTSSIYMRGLGSRIDQAVVGLSVDGVPFLTKDAYDFDIPDIAVIDVLRGARSVLNGRNAMAGQINIYTLSPRDFQGVRAMVEYGRFNSLRASAGVYGRINPRLFSSLTAAYNTTDGYWRNAYNGKRTGEEHGASLRWKTVWHPSAGLSLTNTASGSFTRQSGYPYASAQTRQIAYNDTCFYRRNTFADGLTLAWAGKRVVVTSLTSVAYLDDNMTLDQDFTPADFFTLSQLRREWTVTEDLFAKGSRGAYSWLGGVFGYWRRARMHAPVEFKEDGVTSLIEDKRNEMNPSYPISWDSRTLPLESHFTTPSGGFALYHQSRYRLGDWVIDAALRWDLERVGCNYANSADASYTTWRVLPDGTREKYTVTPVAIHDAGKLRDTYNEILPKLSVARLFGWGRVYATVSKAFKAGGFNTQMFSDVLQQKMMNEMGFGTVYDADKVVSYEPEYSWNYELGGHFSCMEGAVRGDFALFYIDCRDQQLTIFPEGTTTGRMMTNAGRTRSFGGELSLQVSPWQNLDINAAYGYTNARFVRYNDGKTDYKGNYLPYAPQHTLAATGAWTIPTGVPWLGNIVLQAGVRCAGRIWWNEENSLSQPFYALTEASLRFEQKHYSVDIWGRNLADAGYNVFYFKSIGNEFVQRGRPRTFGITLNINL